MTVSHLNVEVRGPLGIPPFTSLADCRPTLKWAKKLEALPNYVGLRAPSAQPVGASTAQMRQSYLPCEICQATEPCMGCLQQFPKPVGVFPYIGLCSAWDSIEPMLPDIGRRKSCRLLAKFNSWLEASSGRGLESRSAATGSCSPSLKPVGSSSLPSLGSPAFGG